MRLHSLLPYTDLVTIPRAEATIVKAAKVPVHKHDRYHHYEYVVEVRPDGEAPFRAKLSQPETDPSFAFPNEGQAVGVRFHPKSRKVKWDHADPRSFNTTKLDDQRAELDAALRAPAGPPPTNTP
jgi:hypothetical protein